jgi:hypothetical protein
MEWEITGGELLAALIALGSLVVAGVALRMQMSTSAVASDLAERSNALQERIARIEEDRRSEEISRAGQAEVRVSLVRKPDKRGKSREYLVLDNIGEASAIDVSLDAIVVRGDGHQPFQYDASLFPIPELKRGSAVETAAILTLGTGMTFDVTVSWSDARGRQTEYQLVTLTR